MPVQKQSLLQWKSYLPKQSRTNHEKSPCGSFFVAMMLVKLQFGIAVLVADKGAIDGAKNDC